MEIKTKLETFRVEKQCDECKAGTMVATGKSLTQYGQTEYEHKCNSCGSVLQIANKMYPTIEYDVVPKSQELVKEKTETEKKIAAPKKTAAPRKIARNK